MLSTEILLRAYSLMCTSGAMAETYEANRSICRYVHSTSRGHEAIQLATALHLQPCDFVSPYYRDESLLLGLGFSPYQLMLQLLAKAADPFSGGRAYYSHPNYRGEGKPTIIHQSSATGMQVIPSTGIAQGLQFLEKHMPERLQPCDTDDAPVVVCSLGDASITEGEVSEGFQMAVLKQLPIIYLVQDNRWGISVSAAEARAMDAYEYAAGFKGMERIRIDGSDFESAHENMGRIIRRVRKDRIPYLVQASVPLLGHHTSGVRKEFYRDEKNWAEHLADDPVPKLKKALLDRGVSEEELLIVQQQAKEAVATQFKEAVQAPDPDPETVANFVFVPTPITEEKGIRSPKDAEKVLMVDAGLLAIREIMESNPDALLYGQDVGLRLGGVFREAATLADRYGAHRVFNTAIQEAYIIGSTIGLSALGLKPIVEVQFADYIYTGFNQLASEISKSCYLSMGKFPVQTLIRVPTGAYGGGGPYHSGSIETTLLSIKGLKVVYPSNAADMKGLMKAAFLDPNPVVMLEHKGLYWSKVPGTDEAKTVEPSADYIIPLGKGRMVLELSEEQRSLNSCCVIITYGMGVYWAKTAAKNFEGQISIMDLRSLNPIDEEMILTQVKAHGKCVVLTEEQQTNSFAEALAGRISRKCFQHLDAPVQVMGALDLPAVPMNAGLEHAMLPNADKLTALLQGLLQY